MWKGIFRQTIRRLTSSGWIATILGGIALLLISPLLDRAMKNPKIAIFSFAGGLTILIWTVAIAAILSHPRSVPPAIKEPIAKGPSLTEPPSDPPICNGPIDASPDRLKIDWKLIPEEQARREITEALHKSDIDLAVAITRSLASTSAQLEEARRVLSVCMSNKCYERAKIVISEFYGEQDKATALSEIAKEQKKIFTGRGIQ